MTTLQDTIIHHLDIRMFLLTPKRSFFVEHYHIMRTGTPYAQYIEQQTASTGLTPISSAKITIGVITKTYQAQYQQPQPVNNRNSAIVIMPSQNTKLNRRTTLCNVNPISSGSSKTNLSSIRRQTRLNPNTQYGKEIFTQNYASKYLRIHLHNPCITPCKIYHKWWHTTDQLIRHPEQTDLSLFLQLKADNMPCTFGHPTNTTFINTTIKW